MNSLPSDRAVENQIRLPGCDQPGECLDSDGLELRISANVSLVHDLSVEEGKTRGMAKGLFLHCNGRVCAGESAGFGVPVWNTRFKTFFPSLVCIKKTSACTIEMHMSLDRALSWDVAGLSMPVFFTQALEQLVAVYMKTDQQKRMLALREILFSLFSVRSKMVQVPGAGICRVTLEASPEGLLIRADGSKLRGRGRLIMLNEVAGQFFTRLKNGEKMWEGSDIPGWISAGRSVCLESPFLGLAVSISRDEEESLRHGEMFCGREVANGLNWAGFAVTAPTGMIAYRVGIRERVYSRRNDLLESL